MLIREAIRADAGALAGIFYRAVQIGAAGAYDAAQRRVWCDVKPTSDAWSARLDGLLTLVAERDGELLGFMSLRLSDGYLDLAFVDPDVRGTGVANDIYAVLENRARAAGQTRLSCHASIMAKPFLTRQGWQILRRKDVKRDGIALPNWKMEKTIEAEQVTHSVGKMVENSVI